MSTEITDVRTVHSRAYTAYNALLEVKKTWYNGFHLYEQELVAQYAKYANHGWRVPTQDEIRRQFEMNEWTPERERILCDLLETVKLLDKYARPNKKYKP